MPSTDRSLTLSAHVYFPAPPECLSLCQDTLWPDRGLFFPCLMGFFFSLLPGKRRAIKRENPALLHRCQHKQWIEGGSSGVSEVKADAGMT